MFKIGQKLVFIGALLPINRNITAPIKGAVYTYSGLSKKKNYITLKEFPDIRHYSSSFRPIDEIMTREIASQFKEVEEKIDIEIQELVCS